jgi:hypothetical protein
LFAIANRDEPRILKSVGSQGKFRNAHRLVEEKLDVDRTGQRPAMSGPAQG